MGCFNSYYETNLLRFGAATCCVNAKFMMSLFGSSASRHDFSGILNTSQALAMAVKNL